MDQIPRPRALYGSFYLRVGCVIFGIGSMIYSGIEMGMVMEVFFETSSCQNDVFSIIRPLLQLTYVFVQMYFVFLNQKVSKAKFD